jgi:hypothetical protein
MEVLPVYETTWGNNLGTLCFDTKAEKIAVTAENQTLVILLIASHFCWIHVLTCFVWIFQRKVAPKSLEMF